MTLQEINFWKRLEMFIKDIQVNDPMSEEEKEMILNICKREQASFISSKQDVIKSVCQKCGVEMEGATYKGYKMCHICREWQTVL